MKQHQTFRFDSELLKSLKAEAKKQRRSFNNYVEVALMDHVINIKNIKKVNGNA